MSPGAQLPSQLSRAVYFRLDAGQELGFGHLMRCLALAARLQEAGFTCQFMIRRPSEAVIRQIEDSGYILHPLEGADTGDHDSPYSIDQRHDARQCKAVMNRISESVLVLDHYGIDDSWLRSLDQQPAYVLVIDDLANRKYVCDLLLDQTHGRSERDYRALVPDSANILCGADFALLRRDFEHKRPIALRKREQTTAPKKLLVNFGGGGRRDLSLWCLRMLTEHFAYRDLTITVIEPGSSADHIRSTVSTQGPISHKVVWFDRVDDMAQYMSEADIAIGAAGSAAWERCALGLPSLLFIIADNQRLICEKLVSSGAALLIGNLDADSDLSRYESCFVEGLQQLLGLDAYQKMSQQAAALCDGRGAGRVLRNIQDGLSAKYRV